MRKGQIHSSRVFFAHRASILGMLGSGGERGMTKADLVEKVTGLGDLTRRDGEVIVETIFESVINALQTGDKIEIRGFGSFPSPQAIPAMGANPKLGNG